VGAWWWRTVTPAGSAPWPCECPRVWGGPRASCAAAPGRGRGATGPAGEPPAEGRRLLPAPLRGQGLRVAAGPRVSVPQQAPGSRPAVRGPPVDPRRRPLRPRKRAKPSAAGAAARRCRGAKIGARQPLGALLPLARLAPVFCIALCLAPHLPRKGVGGCCVDAGTSSSGGGGAGTGGCCQCCCCCGPAPAPASGRTSPPAGGGVGKGHARRASPGATQPPPPPAPAPAAALPSAGGTQQRSPRPPAAAAPRRSSACAPRPRPACFHRCLTSPRRCGAPPRGAVRPLPQRHLRGAS